MQIDMASIDIKRRYKLISGAIVPRPIAWITSLDAKGVCNAAPFSAFNYMSEDPPLVCVGLQLHYESGSRAGEVKDTTRNIAESGEFVVNLTDQSLNDRMVDSAVPFPAGDSEVEQLGLAVAPSVTVRVPRIAEAPIAFECRRVTMLNFSAARSILIGEILQAHVRDDIIDAESFNIDLVAYKPVGRLFGSLYCHIDKPISIPTKTYDQWLKSRESQ